MFYNKFIALCAKGKITPSVAAKEIGINKSAVSNWKRKKNGPSDVTINKIADYFGVPVSELIGEQKEEPSAEDGKGLHDTMYNALTPEEKDSVDLMIESLYKRRFGG